MSNGKTSQASPRNTTAQIDALNEIAPLLGQDCPNVMVDVVDDQTPRVRLTLAAARASNRPQTINLGALPPGQRVALEIQAPANHEEIIITGVVTGASAELHLVQHQIIDLRANDGEVILATAPTEPYITSQDNPGHLTLADGVRASVEALDDNGPEVHLRGGHLVVIGTLSSVSVSGKGIISSGSKSGVYRTPKIRALTYCGNTELVVSWPRVAVGQLACEEAAMASLPTLTLRVSTTDKAPDGQRHTGIRISSLKNVRIAGEQNVSLITGSITASTIAAPLGIALNRQGEITSTEFNALGRQWVTLNTDGGAVLDASGQLELRTVRNLQLTGSVSGLTIRDRGSAGPDDQVSWEGAVMTHVRLPDGLDGRRLLPLVATAYHFSPDTRGLPGWDQTILAQLKGQRQVDYAKEPRRLSADAEYLRELVRVCRDKGAPGSVTTQVAWCAYRLRALKARGVERVALAAYRLLGYGERPAPAFLLWILLSFALAGPVLALQGSAFEASPNGVGNYIVEVGRLLLGPLTGLTRSGSLDSGPEIAEIAARAATAIPVITGAVALRNYVKAER